MENDIGIVNNETQGNKYRVTAKVENYSEQSNNVGIKRMDIIKIVTITAKYQFRGNNQEIVLRKLKIKE